MGLLTTMDESNAANALQSVKEHEDRLASLETATLLGVCVLVADNLKG
jgi:hypothetical protein